MICPKAERCDILYCLHSRFHFEDRNCDKVETRCDRCIEAKSESVVLSILTGKKIIDIDRLLGGQKRGSKKIQEKRGGIT